MNILEFNQELERYKFVLKNAKDSFIIINTNSIGIRKMIIAQAIKQYTEDLVGCVDCSKSGVNVITDVSELKDKKLIVIYNIKNLEEEDTYLQLLNYYRDLLHNLKLNLLFVVDQSLLVKIINSYPNLFSYVQFTFDFIVSIRCPFTLMYFSDYFPATNKSYLSEKKKILLSAVNSVENKSKFDILVDKLNYFKAYSGNPIDLNELYSEVVEFYQTGEVPFKYSCEILLKLAKVYLRHRYFKIALNILIQLLWVIYWKACYGEKLEFSKANSDMHRLNLLLSVLEDDLRTLAESDDFNFTIVFKTAINIAYLCEKLHAENHIILAWYRFCLKLNKNYLGDVVENKARILNDVLVYQYHHHFEYRTTYDQLKSLQNITDNHISFIVQFNLILINLLNNHQAIGHLDGFKKIIDAYDFESPMFLKGAALYAWILGYYHGNVSMGLDLLKDVLKLARRSFAENHISIAEIHYCNAALYYLNDQRSKAFDCAKKAINIAKICNNQDFLDLCIELREVVTRKI